MTGCTELRYRVEGMDCPSCAGKVETALSRIAGVISAHVNYATASLRVSVADAQVGDTVEKVIRALGYLPTLHYAQRDDAKQHAHPPGGHLDTHRDEAFGGSLWRNPKAGLVAGIGTLIGAGYAAMALVAVPERWAFGVAVVIGLLPFLKRAAQLARLGSPFSIEMLMVTATVGALAIGESAEAAIVIFLFALGELLESVAAGSARAGIRSLIRLVPRVATLEDQGATREVPIDHLAIGQTILVRPGERVPVDGEIIAGDSNLDESPVTGESVPVARSFGGRVLAGTINLTAALRVRVTTTAADNTIARIVRLVEEAQESKAPTARFIDRFSRYYTPAAMLMATLTIVFPPLVFGASWELWLYRGLSLLLIACPCALVLSTPAAIASGLAAGARHGLLIKGGAALETIGKVSTVAFDKTGTLTEGRPRVTDVIALSGDTLEALALAAAVESGSAHPIGGAIIEEAKARGLTVHSAETSGAIAGKAVEGRVGGTQVAVGSPRYASERNVLDDRARAAVEKLESEGSTVVVVIANDISRAIIAVRDEPRGDAKEGIAALHDLGIRTVMLTGDNQRTGKAIADKLGLDVHAELLPAAKLEKIGKLKRAAPVAMVGDGINDAPALAAASVGIAMGGGTDVALETADAALMKGRVTGVAELIRLSRATLLNIRQNIAVSVGLKVVFLATTLTGTTTMWMAILADTGATVLVTLNALRLLSFKPHAHSEADSIPPTR